MNEKQPWEIDEKDEFLLKEDDLKANAKDSDDTSTMLFDPFCRYSLSRRSILICFLFNFLERIIFNHIDLKSIKVEPSGVLTDELRQFWTDLTISFKIIGHEFKMVIIIEHKSGYDRFMLLKMLRYLVNYWELERRNKESRLTRIIPIIIYNGLSDLNIENMFDNMFKDLPDDLPEDLKQALIRLFDKTSPRFEPIFKDFNKIREEDLKGSFEFLTFFRMLKYGHTDLGGAFDKTVEELKGYLKDHRFNDFMKSFLVSVGTYASRSPKINEKQIGNMINAIRNEDDKEDLKMTLAQKWKEEGIDLGRDLGRKEGRDLGRKEGKMELAKNLKMMGMSTEQISKASGLTEEEIDNL